MIGRLDLTGERLLTIKLGERKVSMQGISVVIPVYNRERHLKQAIQSVLDQEFSGTLEIIISDDGSTDRSIQIAESFGSVVKIIRKPKKCMSQGVAGARNRGIQVATQPYICFLDSDDFYLSGYINRMIEIMKSRQDIGFAFCRTKKLEEISGTRNFAPWTRKVVNSDDVKYLGLTRSKLIHIITLIVRTEVFQQIGMFNESYSNGEDGDFWIRLGENYSGIFSDFYGAVYRVNHSAEQLSKNSSHKIDDCALRVFSSALQRCRLLKTYDPYRHFLIKMKIFGIKYSRKYHLFYRAILIGLMITHPICSIRYIQNIMLTRHYSLHKTLVGVSNDCDD